MSYSRINPKYQREGTYLEYKGRCFGDFNDLETSGIYYNPNGMTANKPTSSAMYGYVIVIAYDAYYVQIAWNIGSIYWRPKSGSPLTWGAWKTIST